MFERMQFHHVGIACENIDETACHYCSLGYDQSETVIDPLQNVKIAFLSHPEMPMIELLSPVNNASPVVDILKKNGTSPYHICYSVSDLDGTIALFRRKRYIIVSKPKIANALGGKRVAFLYNKAVGLIELVGE